MSSTIDAALVEAAQQGRGEFVFHLQDGESRLSLQELAERAAGSAALLAAHGVRPGDTVGLLGPNRPEWAIWAFGVWMAGGVLVALPFPLIMRDRGALTDQLGSLIRAAACRLVVGDPALLPAAAAAHECLAWDHPLAARSPLPEGLSGPEDSAVIQFSSGSTSSPKGAILSHRAVMAEMSMFDARVGDHADRVVGWTPFFHDLGLFLYLVYPALCGRSVDLLPTERFARNPLLWFQLLTSTEATLTIAPAPAFSIASRLASRRPQGTDLRCLEVAWFAAELVDPALADDVLSNAEHLRLDPLALGNGYGLAECVLAVSSTAPGEGLDFDHVDLDELGNAGRAVAVAPGPKSRRVASCGLPLDGCEIRVAGPAGVLSERSVGEVEVRGPSAMAGFVGPDVAGPFVDGWLRTGDLGYLSEGELFVTGRSKDMVIVMGHNLYPEDFEWAADRVPGVRKGHCVAFSRPESEKVVVLVEASVHAAGADVRGSVARSISETLGVFGSEVVLVPRGSVLRTTSGKVRRSAMKEAYARGELPAPAQRLSALPQ